jgi:hypothetical protein
MAICNATVPKPSKGQSKVTSERSEMRATPNDGEAKTDVWEENRISGAAMTRNPWQPTARDLEDAYTWCGREADRDDRNRPKIP